MREGPTSYPGIRALLVRVYLKSKSILPTPYLEMQTIRSTKDRSTIFWSQRFSRKRNNEEPRFTRTELEFEEGVTGQRAQVCAAPITDAATP